MVLHGQEGITDGDPLVLGDKVYDVIQGFGVVIELRELEEIVVVRFGQKRFAYKNTGVGPYPSKRTLYWDDPIICIPMKNKNAWNLLIDIVKSLSRLFQLRWKEI